MMEMMTLKFIKIKTLMKFQWAVVRENGKKNPDDANATEDFKKEGFNEDLEANDEDKANVEEDYVKEKESSGSLVFCTKK